MIGAPVKGNKIGFGLIFWGLFFFFNPYFAVLDFLPDSLGCLLVYLGLSRLSHISYPLREARVKFLHLCEFLLVKDVAVLVVFGMSTKAEQPVSLLILSFVSAVVGLYLALPAVNGLFEGIYALAILDGVPPTDDAYLSRADKMLRFTTFFLVFREAICLLPEFTALSTCAYTDSAMIQIYDYIGLLRGVAIIIILVAGVVFIARLGSYFSYLRRLTEFREALGTREVQKKISRPGDTLAAKCRFAFFLFTVGAFFLADFYIDFHNVIPDVLGAALFLTGILVADFTKKQKMLGGVLSFLYGAVCVISSRLSYQFAIEYSAGEISKTEEAATAFFTMWMTSFFELVVFVVFLAFLLFLFRHAIDVWACYIPRDAEGVGDRQKRAAFMLAFDKELIRLFVLGFLSALLSFLFDYLKEIPNEKAWRFMELLWALDFGVALLFATVLGFTLSGVYNEIHHRYFCED